jgi:hypothetical protein
VLLRAERREDLLRGAAVVEGERRGAVPSDDLRGDRQLAEHRAAKGNPLVHDERGAGHEESDGRRQKVDQRQFALDRQVSEKPERVRYMFENVFFHECYYPCLFLQNTCHK